jgi:ketosteroid isomerase-like protein
MSNVEIVKSAYEALARGDVPCVLAVMDPEIEWYEAEGNPYMPSGKALIGPDAVLNNLFMRLGTDWDGFAVHPAAYHDAGDTVVVEARYSGTHRVTGKRMNPQVCHVWTVRHGRLAKFQQYVDTAQLQDVMGVRVSV